MKIEVGKDYKTRDGLKARIYALDGESNFPVHGAIFDKKGWTAYTWDTQGSSTHFSDTHLNDLVSEWVDFALVPMRLTIFQRPTGNLEYAGEYVVAFTLEQKTHFEKVYPQYRKLSYRLDI